MNAIQRRFVILVPYVTLINLPINYTSPRQVQIT